MLDRLRGAMTRAVTPVARFLLRLGVSPDAVTIAGTVGVVAASLWFLPRGQWVAGPLVIAAFTLTDLLDGTMARVSGRVSTWGAFLDSTLARFGDAAIFTGLLLGLVALDDDLTAGLALACLVLGSIVPYARARAEGLGMTAAVGIAERADRLAIALVATVVVGYGAPLAVLVWTLGVLAALSAITVVQRMATVRTQARALAAVRPSGAGE